MRQDREEDFLDGRTRMNVRKLAAFLAVAVMTVTMTACGAKQGASSDAGVQDGKDTDGKSYAFGVVQLVEHPALDAATQGFQDAVKEKFGEDKVSFDVQNAQGEQNMCSTIVNNFVSANVDLILANATLPLQTAAQATGDIPILGTSITDYGTALGISDWKGTTGMNVSGTSDLAPIDEQAALLTEIVPDAKKVGILYCSAEPNSKYQAQLFAEEMKKKGIETKEFTAADSNEIQTVTQNAVEECDALYIPTDNTMASNTQIINNITLPAKVPVIAGEQGICEGCGLATLSISYYDLGYETGEMAYDVLVGGKDISTMEVKTAPKVTKLYNASIAKELGVNIPDGYEALEQ